MQEWMISFDQVSKGAVNVCMIRRKFVPAFKNLVHEDIYDKFMAGVIERTKLLNGSPACVKIQWWVAQAPMTIEKILFIMISETKGAIVLCGGEKCS